MINIKNIDDLREIATDKITIINSVNNKISEIESEIISALQGGTSIVESIIQFYEYQFAGMDQATSSRLVAYFVIKNLTDQKYTVKYGSDKYYIWIKIYLSKDAEINKKLQKFFSN